MTHTFHLIFRPEPEGGYTVLVPSLPGCITWAATPEEGRELIAEAITAYLESVAQHTECIEDDTKTFISSITCYA